MKPAEGSKAPQFVLNDADGKKVKLSDFKGQKVVLYFYPRDNTPGCTKEACGFRSDLAKFNRAKVVVLGVSTDDEKSHVKFRDNYDLNFPLLADVEHKVAESYGVWQEKNMYGKKVWGIKRMTFIIDEEGRIARVFGKVITETHSQDVLDALAFEPARIRSREPLLLSLRHFLWNIPFYRLAQQQFAVACLLVIARGLVAGLVLVQRHHLMEFSKLEANRQLHGEIHQVVVKKRYARF